MPHLSACSAYCCSWRSIVSSSESPATGALTVWSTWSFRPVASRSTCSDAVGAAQLGLVLGLDARLADQVVGQVALAPQGLQLGRVDRPRVADDLGDERSFGYSRLRLDDDLDPGQIET